MLLSPNEIKEIVFDEEKYINHYRSRNSMLRPNDDAPTITVPASSFTAFRLMHASPVEISSASKVVLLGGVPKLWYSQHSNSFLKSVSKIGYRKLRNRVKLVAGYTYSWSYNPRRSNLNYGYQKRFRRLRNNIHRGGSYDTFWEPTVRKRANRESSDDEEMEADSYKEEETDELDEAEDFVQQLPFRKAKTDFAVPASAGLMKTSPRPILKEANTVANQGYRDNFLRDKRKIEVVRQRLEGLDIVNDVAKHDSDTYYSADDELPPLQDQEDETMSEDSPETFGRAWDLGNGLHRNGYRPSLQLPTLANTETSNKKGVSVSFTENAKKNNINRLQSITNDGLTDSAESDSSYHLPSNVPRLSLKPNAISKRSEMLQLLKPEPHTLTKIETDQLPNPRSKHPLLKQVRNIASKAKHKVQKEVSHVLDKELTLPQKFFKRYKVGEIVKLEKMLVMVKSAVSARNPPLNFSEVEPVDTRVLERWKEYIVVARATGNIRSPLYIQFYRNREIPKIVKHGKRKKFVHSMDFFLDTACVVGLYSSLDKTIHVLKPNNRHNLAHDDSDSDKEYDSDPFKIYILRCNTLLSSGRWLTLLRESIGLKTISEEINIHIPKVEASLRISIPIKLQKELAKAEFMEENLKVILLPRGYKVIPFPIRRYLAISIRESLIKAGLQSKIQEWERANVLMGFSWKHYDRLEWCFGDQYDLLHGTFALSTSHLLEYRPLVHYPRIVPIDNGKTLTEPTPIEGFLARCSSRYGSDTTGPFQKNYFKFLYFFTSDGLLFFMKSFKGIPPLPESNLVDRNGFVLNLNRLTEVLQDFPSVYEHNPYPLDLNSHISWFNNKMKHEEFTERDSYAFSSMYRRVSQIIRAQGLIDLTTVVSVDKLPSSERAGTDVSYAFLNTANNFVWKNGASLDQTFESIIVMKLENGTQVKLLAPNPKTADEWVYRLSQLSIYWKARKKQDLKRMWDVKVSNLYKLKIEEYDEANITENTPKWVTDRGIADDVLYNVSTYAMLRPLVCGGYLYQKPRKHSVFRKYFIALVPGFMILYECFKRSTTGFSKDIADYRHYMTIPIEECYVYSGNTTALDLLTRDVEFDPLVPGNHSLPRAYADGWKSTEDESSKCFTLWFGTKRAISNYDSLLKYESKNKKSHNHSQHENSEGHLSRNSYEDRDDLQSQPEVVGEQNFEKNPGVFRMVSRLGVTGRSMVFMARSRQERDQWVLKIYTELERLKNSSETEQLKLV